MNQIQYFDLAYIGNKADKLQELFSEYSSKPNANGSFLKFENYKDHVVNLGVLATTNCFENEAHFLDRLHLKLLDRL